MVLLKSLFRKQKLSRTVQPVNTQMMEKRPADVLRHFV